MREGLGSDCLHGMLLSNAQPISLTQLMNLLNALRGLRACLHRSVYLLSVCHGIQLFVGSDANADGNLDFEEFVAMIKHIKTNRPRRELLRMFSELTLHRCVCICDKG